MFVGSGVARFEGGLHYHNLTGRQGKKTVAPVTHNILYTQGKNTKGQ